MVQAETEQAEITAVSWRSSSAPPAIARSANIAIRTLPTDHSSGEVVDGNTWKDSRHAVSLLQAKVEQQAATIRELRAAASEQERLRQKAEEEVVEQREDIAEQACDQAELESEIQRLESERDDLRGNLVRARADYTCIERKFCEAERHLADKEELARKPARVLAQKERKNQQLQKQLEAKAVLIKAVKEQLEEARKKAHAAISDVAEEEARERLLQRLSAAHRAQALSEDKCWQLEERLEDREKELEEARAELQRLKALSKQEEDAKEDSKERKATKYTNERMKIEALEAEAEVRNEQLRTTTEALAERESITSHLQSKIQEKEIEDSQRLQAVTKRCGDLEAAGKKLLLELDEKDRLLRTQELAAQAAEHRASELQELLDSRPAFVSVSPAPVSETSNWCPDVTNAVAVPETRDNSSIVSDCVAITAQRIWVSGSCRDSGSEVSSMWVSGSGRESSCEGSHEERSATTRSHRTRVRRWIVNQPEYQDCAGDVNELLKPRRRPAKKDTSHKIRAGTTDGHLEHIRTWRGCHPSTPDGFGDILRGTAEASLCSSDRRECSIGNSGVERSSAGVDADARWAPCIPARGSEKNIESNDDKKNVQLCRDVWEAWTWKNAPCNDYNSRYGAQWQDSDYSTWNWSGDGGGTDEWRSYNVSWSDCAQ